MKVKRLELWTVDRKGVRNVRKIKPSSQTVPQMKIDIAQALEPLLRRIEYYYVVVVVEKSDGGEGFRTIVPKTKVA